jgi:hypothetical protein
VQDLKSFSAVTCQLTPAPFIEAVLIGPFAPAILVNFPCKSLAYFSWTYFMVKRCSINYGLSIVEIIREIRGQAEKIIADLNLSRCL